MDPLSMTASIGSLCGVTVKLIVSISEFVDAVQQAPSEVQTLNNALASLYACLGQVKMAIQAPRVSEIPGQWKTDFEKLATDCEETLREVQILVTKAKTTETTGTAKQVWKTTKFAFKAKQVELLRGRIVMQNGILQTLLAALTETRGAQIEQRLEDIHVKVEELISSRQNAKDVLGVLENESAEEAQYVLSDRTSRAQPKSADGSWKTLEESKSSQSAPDLPDGMPSTMERMSSVDGQAAITRDLTQAFQGLGQQVMDLNSTDIVKKVFTATKPSSDMLRAIELISSKTWRLARCRLKKTYTGTWVNVKPKHPYFSMQISLAEHNLELNTRLYSRKKETSSARFEHGGRWTDATFTIDGCVVKDYPAQSRFSLGEVSDDWSWMEYTFYNSQDANEVYFCLSTIVPKIHQAWRIHATAFNAFKNLGGESVYNSDLLDIQAYRLAKKSSTAGAYLVMYAERTT